MGWFTYGTTKNFKIKIDQSLKKGGMGKHHLHQGTRIAASNDLSTCNQSLKNSSNLNRSNKTSSEWMTPQS
jgi:hypothetical protein